MAKRRTSHPPAPVDQSGPDGSGFAVLLRMFRAGKVPGISVRKLAAKIKSLGGKVSYSYLAALESGREKNPSRELVERIADALELTVPDRKRLVQASGISDALIAPGVDLDVQKSLDRQLQTDVQEVWVVAQRPLELSQGWIARVAKNIVRGVRYVYFVAGRDCWDTCLKPDLLTKLKSELRSEEAAKEKLNTQVTCIEVTNSFLRPYFFRPPWALFIGSNKGALAGVWTKLSPQADEIEKIYQMDSTSVQLLYETTDLIRRAVQQGGEAVVEGPMRFPKVHPKEELR